MRSDAPFELVAMQPWMIRGMAELQALQYKVDPEKAESRLRRWFDSDFAHRRGSIALAGVAGERVIAMQTYSAWPYVRNGVSYRSLQSGATLVHPDFRGRKIFQRLLLEGNRLAIENGHDFFVGFPVPMSLGGFVKDGWTNLGSLRWWTRPLRPFALMRRSAASVALQPPPCPGKNLSIARLATIGTDDDAFSLSNDLDFLSWRYADRPADFGHYSFSSRNRSVDIILKSTSKHGFREILAGQMRHRNASPAFVARALLALAWAAYRNGAAAVSTALLNPRPTTLTAMLLAGFVPGKSTAPLIVKPLRPMPEVTSKQLWRGTCLEDIDTW